MLKAMNMYGVYSSTRVCKEAYRTGQAPKQSQTSVIMPIHKKGDKRKCTNYKGMFLINVPGAFLCNVPNTSRTILFSDKAWVYKLHFELDCNNCSMAQWRRAPRREGNAALVLMAQWLRAPRREGNAPLVLGSILVAASLETCFQQSSSSR